MGADGGSSSDLWDISRGTVITASSGARVGSDLRDMFGGTFSEIEIGHALFQDKESEGFVHFVEWKTPSTVHLESFRLFAIGDSPLYNNEREFARFTLKAKSNPSGDFDIVLFDTTPSHPYALADSSQFLVIEANVKPTVAQYFRAEFVQFNGYRGFDGPRIIELDGYETPVADESRDFLWVQQGGGNGADRGDAVAVDPKGSIYVAGEFSGSANFGTRVLTGSGATSAFLAKYENGGNLVWLQQISGKGNDFARGVSTDSAGNVFVAGTFDDETTFYSSASDLASSVRTVIPKPAGGSGIFLASYDGSGNLRRTSRFGGTGRTSANGIALDTAGNIYVAGGFEGSEAFGASVVASIEGSRDILVAKFDNAGQLVWARRAGGKLFDEALGIAIDHNGGIVVTGRFEGASDFGGVTLNGSGDADIFVAKYDGDGNVLWAKKAGGSRKDTGNGIATDKAGNIYLTGMFYDRATFDSSAISATGTNSDIFIAKYNPSGNLIWVKTAGGPGADIGAGIAADADGNVFVTGSFEVAPNFNSTLLVTSGATDLFGAKYGESGDLIWARNAGGNKGDAGAGIAVDTTGNAFITGSFQDQATFRNRHLTGRGVEDMFLAKMHVLVSPVAKIDPARLDLEVGSDANFVAHAFADPPATFQWQFNGMDLAGENTAKLTVKGIRFEDAGGYGVVVRNSLGATTSIVARLSVLNPLADSATVSTLAGSGAAGYVDGLGSAAQFNSPNDLSIVAGGLIYVADASNNRIRKMSPQGQVTTYAGAGVAGYLDGTGATAQFNLPLSVFAPPSGEVIVADTGNNRIRRIGITSSRLLTTIAGTGESGYLDGPVGTAKFNFPNDVVADTAGALYVSEFNNHTVRKIFSGTVSTLAGAGVSGYADATGKEARFNQPAGLALDKAGNLYVSEWGNQRLRKVTPDGVVSTLAGAGVSGFKNGNAAVAQFNQPDDLATSANGNIFVVEHGNHAMRKVSPGGAVTTVAGTGQPGNVDGKGRDAKFSSPAGLAIDAAGNLIVADTGNNTIRKITFAALPVITLQPRNQVVRSGTTATFSVSAAGPAPINYQWRFNGSKIANATNATLVITNIQSANIGFYSVLVNDSAGTVSSDAALIELSPPAQSVERELPPNYSPGVKFKVTLHAQLVVGTFAYAIQDTPPSGWVVSSISDSGQFDAANKDVKFGPFFDANARTLSYEVTPSLSDTGRKEFAGVASVNGENSVVGGPNTIEWAPALHPADNNPADNRISVDELTAYGAAWRRGTSWPVAPNPIPINYVTRAGLLWKGGEIYRFDPSIPNAPLWWVNNSSARLMGLQNLRTPGSASQTNLVASVQPSRFVPGDPITVRISIQPRANVSAFAIEDGIPEGWSVANVTDDGTFDASSRKLRWGPFLDAQPRIVSYQVTPNQNSDADTRFVGEVSIDGASIVIPGARQLRATSRLDSVRRLPNGELSLKIRGKAGTEFRIETSNDLSHWIEVGRVSMTEGEMDFQTPALVGAPQQFFRAVEQ